MFKRLLLVLCNVATVGIFAVADMFRDTHLWNPAWPGHARFHLGIQFTSLSLLAAVGTYFLLRRKEVSRAELVIGTLAPATFWPGLFVAALIPGADVYSTEGARQNGYPANLAVAGFMVALTALGWMWSVRGGAPSKGGPESRPEAGFKRSPNTEQD